MEIFKHLIVALLDIAALTVLVHAQSQSDLGFISIDCGLLQTSGYTDEKTGIDYTSDANFTETGASFNISSEYNLDTLEQPFRTVRSFPTGIKNCYTVKLTRPNVKFLIRASFMYGNYDGKSKPPRFDLLLEADVWDTIEFINSSTVVTKEILHLPQRNYVHVCLVNTYSGTPFISSLELRPLNNLTYTTQSGSLLLHLRLDVGSNSRIPIRYKDDIYDRIWTPYSRSDWKEINTSLPVNPDSEYQQPSAVMRTAVIPADGSDCLTYSVAACPDNAAQYHVYMHFAELQAQEQVNNEPRQLFIYGSGKLWYNIPYVPSYLDSGILYSSANGSNLDFSINKTQNSPLPPILNAIEVYREQELSQPLTDQQDVAAITYIKTRYGVQRSTWQGDPCSPKVHMWQGLQCFYDGYNPPRIISLDLSSSGISGAIPPSISSLTKLQYLDLSYNSLSGPVPNFLSQMAFLVELNLTGNKLKGVVPAELKERMDAGILTLRVEGNPGLALNKKKNKEPLLIAATVVPAVNLVATLSTIWILKTRNKAAAAKALENLASEEYPGEDGQIRDVPRENGPNNAATNEDTGCASRKSILSSIKRKLFKGKAPRLPPKAVAALSKQPKAPEAVASQEYSKGDNVNFGESIKDCLDNTTTPEGTGDIDDLTNIKGEGDPNGSTIVKGLDRAASNPTRMLAEGSNLMRPNIPAEVPYLGSNKPQSSSFGVNPGDGSPSHKGPNLPSGRGRQVRGKAPSSSRGNSANPIGALFDDATKCDRSDAAAQPVDSSPQESLEKAALSAYMSAESEFPDPSHALETITEGEYRSPSDLHSHPKIHAMSNQMANLERGLKAKQKEIGPLKAPCARLEADVHKLHKMSQQGILPNQPYIDQSNFMPSPLDKKDAENLKNKNEAASSTGGFDFPEANTQENEEVEVPTGDQDSIPSEGADPPTNA